VVVEVVVVVVVVFVAVVVVVVVVVVVFSSPTNEVADCAGRGAVASSSCSCGVTTASLEVAGGAGTAREDSPIVTLPSAETTAAVSAACSPITRELLSKTDFSSAVDFCPLSTWVGSILLDGTSLRAPTSGNTAINLMNMAHG
jgi:hypothetical protein